MGQSGLNINSFFEDERVDGIDKVTGKATYSAEHDLANMAYAVFVCSTIPKGAISNMQVGAAKNAPGVIDIIHHLNCPVIPGYNAYFKDPNKKGYEWRGLKVFNNNMVYSYGQPIALVVADTLERAVYAASLVKATYVKEPFSTAFEEDRTKETKLKKSGDYKRGEADFYKNAAIKIEAEYEIPIETHNPMELHATTAVWNGDNQLTVYDKSQGPKGTQRDLANNFGLEEKNVRVVTEFVGGAFGSALRSWPHVPAAVIAAKKVNRPVKLMITREQMFTTVGYRPEAWQKIGISANEDGTLTGITHHAVSNTSTYEDFGEGIVNVSQFVYGCPNVNTSYRLLPLDLNTPTWMRGPGPATGCFALESALDELSYNLKMDPIELRLRNEVSAHPVNKLPWTTRFLKECYELGKKGIGWEKRPATPGSLKEDGMLVGYGMAVGVFGAGRGQAAAKGILKADGSFVMQSAVSDMGPGTATAMVNIGAELMGLPKQKVFFELGDTNFPPGPTQGGSGSTSAIGTAINAVCAALQETLKEMAIAHIPAFKDAKPTDISYKNGSLSLPSGASVMYTEVIAKSDKPLIEVVKDAARATAEAQKYAMNSFSAHFVKLHVHPITGVVKIKHIVSVADCGKIIAVKPARSQMVGGVVGGIGMALTEETVVDHRYGKYINANFADYHVPVNADTPPMDIFFVNEPDNIISPTGAKGIGEIALVGVAPAIANAVYNATGKRIRRLPITPDKIIG